MSKNILTQSRLKEVLTYNPETGIFLRNIATAMRNKIGEEAGYLDKSTGYRRITIDSQKHGAHRLAVLYMDGVMPNVTDHLNRIKTDNRYCNLKDTTQNENCRNKSLSKNNKSGIDGVRKVKSNWETRIFNKNIGRYDSFFDACCARKSAEIKYKFFAEQTPEIMAIAI